MRDKLDQALQESGIKTPNLQLPKNASPEMQPNSGTMLHSTLKLLKLSLLQKQLSKIIVKHYQSNVI